MDRRTTRTGDGAAPEAGGAPTGARGLKGPDVIRGYLKTLPNAPGVYRMLDQKGNALYVGKAKSLKKRVAAYTKLKGQSARIGRAIMATASMEFITTSSEIEALLLESNLIKRLKPRYNVILRDDKSFPHIEVTHDHAFPQITKHRGARAKGNEYFGPFASAGAVSRTLNALQKAFLLRSCSDSVFENRSRPCLLYQIKRCSAPCVGYIREDEYGRLVDQARDFLKGGSRDVQARLLKLMEEASGNMEFERAAVYRDRIRALAHVTSHQGINPRTVDEADVIAAHQEGGQTCIQVFFFRAGQNWGNRAYFPRADKSLTEAEVLAPFVGQFYDNKTPPRLVLLSHEIEGRGLIEEALSVKAERKVEVHVPRRGEKRELVDHAVRNAREALGRRLAESASQARLLDGIADVFRLDSPPRRIEVYDNSHIQGANAVGAMVVAGPDGLMKNHYRKFNIKTAELAPGDDYGMMREVMTRRFQRLIKEETDADTGARSEAWPDLLLIDGGRGQLNAVHEALAELGIDDVAVVAISKGPDRDAGREQFHVRGRETFMLELRNPVLYFLQRLRDEAHRFAIGSHRARRAKAIGKTSLDDIPGVGARRKQALLHHFGSARAVERAGLQDLEAVDGISGSLARRVYDYFRNES